MEEREPIQERIRRMIVLSVVMGSMRGSKYTARPLNLHTELLKNFIFEKNLHQHLHHLDVAILF